MGSRRYRISRRAQTDLEHIASYIGGRNPSAAEHVIDVLISCFSSLADSPEIGAKRDDLRDGLRVYSPPRPAHSYVVCYYPIADGVEISDVIHGARDWPELFHRGDR